VSSYGNWTVCVAREKWLSVALHTGGRWVGRHNRR